MEDMKRIECLYKNEEFSLERKIHFLIQDGWSLTWPLLCCILEILKNKYTKVEPTKKLGKFEIFGFKVTIEIH